MNGSGHNGGVGGAMVHAAGPTLARTQGVEPLEFTPNQEAMIRDTFANGASREEFAVLLEVARARRLNPLLRQIHFVKRFDSQKRRDVWSTQAAIDGLRAIAERTGKYAGQDEPEFIENDRGEIVACKVRVYRRDWQRPSVGVAYWREYVQTTREGAPTRFWSQMPHVMIAKCAEALALRKAFPEDMSGLYVPEEMAQADNSVPYEPPAALPAKPAPDLTLFSDLCDRTDAAEAGAALSAVAKDAVRGHKAGKLSDQQLETIKASVKSKRAVLDAPAPPPSEPKADHDAETGEVTS